MEGKFVLNTLFGKPIRFHFQYDGLVGSEREHYTSGIDKWLLVLQATYFQILYPKADIVVGVVGNWETIGIFKVGTKLPPSKPGMPPKPEEWVRKAMESLGVNCQDCHDTTCPVHPNFVGNRVN